MRSAILGTNDVDKGKNILLIFICILKGTVHLDIIAHPAEGYRLMKDLLILMQIIHEGNQSLLIMINLLAFLTLTLIAYDKLQTFQQKRILLGAFRNLVEGKLPAWRHPVRRWKSSCDRFYRHDEP